MLTTLLLNREKNHFKRIYLATLKNIALIFNKRKLIKTFLCQYMENPKITQLDYKKTPILSKVEERCYHKD
jgi:hypothetical protein